MGFWVVVVSDLGCVFRSSVAGSEEASGVRVLKSAKKLYWCIPTEGLFFRCIYCHPTTGKGISLTEWGSGLSELLMRVLCSCTQ